MTTPESSATPGLAPCPFCGGKAVLRTTEGWSGIGCETDKCPAYLHALMFRTPFDARARWNRRPAPAAADPLQDTGALGYAARLACSMWGKHYRQDAPDWRPLDNLPGILTQIDNMVSGLERRPSPAAPTAEDGSSDALRGRFVDWWDRTYGDTKGPAFKAMAWEAVQAVTSDARHAAAERVKKQENDRA